jgi:hypothetical protein
MARASLGRKSLISPWTATAAPKHQCRLAPKLNIVYLFRNFTLNGPNGQHVCLVYNTLGPSIAALVSEYAEANLKIRPGVARQLADHTCEALGFLH